MPDWERIREDFPALRRFCYLNSAGGGPIPRPVYEKAVLYYRESLEYGDFYWERNLERREQARRDVARLIGALPEEIEFTSSTAQGMNIIADLLSDEGKVLATPLEFPDTTIPWIHRNPAAVEWVHPDVSGAVPASRFVEKMSEKTAVIATSHVQFSNGFRQDLEELGSLKGDHYFVVNATQSLGAFRVDVRKMQIDALCGNSYKWLLSGYGCGVLYVSRRAYEGRRPGGVGWFATQDKEAFRNDSYEFVDSASRFNLGCPSFPTILSLGAAVQYLLQIGLEDIEHRVLLLSRYVTERLQQEGFSVLSPSSPEKYRSSSVLVALDEPEQVVGALKEKGVLCTFKPEGMRVSVHFFNNEEDIETLLRELVSLTR